MKQIAIFSGKGGTGKTSLVASFAALAGRVVAVDADVDAANLALLMPGKDISKHLFWSGRRARIDPARCTGCGACREACRFGAVRPVGGFFGVDPLSCEGCGTCALVCPVPAAITFAANRAGVWKVRRIHTGMLVHAELGIAQDSSGKLVAHLRREAETLVARLCAPYLLIDGPPGIGCPVHAAMGGVDAVVAVTEPSVSGEHDLLRLLDLAAHFRRPACVVINKADLAPAVTARIQGVVRRLGAFFAGEIPFDPGVPHLLARGRTPLEARPETADAIRGVWKQVTQRMENG